MARFDRTDSEVLVRQEHAQVSLELSVVIPAHDEAARILPHLRSIVAYLSTTRHTFEIIVVDDGSRDDTAGIVHRFALESPSVRLLRLPVCTGKGAAVRHGMHAGRGRWLLFTDADGATPIRELARLQLAVESGAQIAIGSRSLASRRSDFTVQARRHRTLLGNCFNRIVRLGGITGISDTQCGFKLFDRAVAQDLFAVSCINGYGFDLELLYIAQRRGYRIAEVPINWEDKAGSKVRLLHDGIGMVRELMAIRRYAEQGRYRDPLAAREVAPLASRSVVLE